MVLFGAERRVPRPAARRRPRRGVRRAAVSHSASLPYLCHISATYLPHLCHISGDVCVPIGANRCQRVPTGGNGCQWGANGCQLGANGCQRKGEQRKRGIAMRASDAACLTRAGFAQHLPLSEFGAYFVPEERRRGRGRGRPRLRPARAPRAKHLQRRGNVGRMAACGFLGGRCRCLPRAGGVARGRDGGGAVRRRRRGPRRPPPRPGALNKGVARYNRCICYCEILFFSEEEGHSRDDNTMKKGISDMTQ
eukprot:gene12627-biopygen6063